MSTKHRIILAMFLCMLLCVCLTPAAFAAGSATGHTVDALQSAINSGKTTFTLDGNMTIPSGTFVNAPNTALVVPANTKLTASGTEEFSTLKLTGGTVEIKGGIFRVNQKLNYQSGTVKIYSGFNLFPAADVLALPDVGSVLTYPEGTRDTNLLFKPTSDREFADTVTLVNGLAANYVADVNIQSAVTLTGQHILMHKTMLRVNGPAGGALTVAEGGLLEYRDCGGTVFLYNMGNPAKGARATVNGNMFLNAIVVEEGSTFATAGNSIVETGVLELSGSAELNGRIFRDNNRFVPLGSGVVKIYSGFNLFPAADVLALLNVDSVLTYPEGAVETSLLFTPTNNNEFADTVTAVNGLADHFVADVNIQSPVTLTGQHVLRHKTELRVSGASLDIAEDALLVYENCGGNVFLNNGASSAISGELNAGNISVGPGCAVTVEEGGVLKHNGNLGVSEYARVTVNGQLHIMPNGHAVVGGTLENNSFVNILKRSDSEPRLIIESTGLYLGPGRIGVKDPGDTDSYFVGLNLDRFEKRTDAYGTQYFPLDAGPELVLPADLTTIEANAFEGCTFGSIYIPSSVTSIAPAAFGGMSGLTIYGAAGSEAETFAGEHNYTFIVYP